MHFSYIHFITPPPPLTFVSNRGQFLWYVSKMHIVCINNLQKRENQYVFAWKKLKMLEHIKHII